MGKSAGRRADVEREGGATKGTTSIGRGNCWGATTCCAECTTEVGKVAEETVLEEENGTEDELTGFVAGNEAGEGLVARDGEEEDEDISFNRAVLRCSLSMVSSIAFARARLGLSVQSANVCNSWQSQAMSYSNVAMSTGIVGISGAVLHELEEGGSGTTTVRETGTLCCSILLAQKKSETHFY